MSQGELWIAQMWEWWHRAIERKQWRRALKLASNIQKMEKQR